MRAKSSCMCSMQIAAHGDSRPAQPVSCAAPQRKSSGGSWDLWGSPGARMQTESRCHAHEPARSGCHALHCKSHPDTHTQIWRPSQSRLYRLSYVHTTASTQGLYETDASKCERASTGLAAARTHNGVGEGLQGEGPDAAEGGASQQKQGEVCHIVVSYVLSTIPAALILSPPWCLPQKIQGPVRDLLQDGVSIGAHIACPESCNRRDASSSGKKKRRWACYLKTYDVRQSKTLDNLADC